jgi:tRNA (guanine-N7-)-methyltransferase
LVFLDQALQLKQAPDGRVAAMANALTEIRHQDRRPKVSDTKLLESPSEYAVALNSELAGFAFDETRVLANRGVWREKAFAQGPDSFLDLEIGTGNGYFFTHRAVQNPARSLVGLELKYKPLVQTIRRALRAGATNARIARYDASVLTNVFAVEEINDVFIHFPDPWPRERSWKHRLINRRFLNDLYQIQKSGSEVDFKTDSQHYFEWALEYMSNSKYQVLWQTRDLHKSEYAALNYITYFESIFRDKGQPIYAIRLKK